MPEGNPNLQGLTAVDHPISDQGREQTLFRPSVSVKSLVCGTGISSFCGHDLINFNAFKALPRLNPNSKKNWCNQSKRSMKATLGDEEMYVG